MSKALTLPSNYEPYLRAQPTAELCFLFREFEAAREHAYKVQGRIIHIINGRLAPGQTVFGILSDHGVSKGSISNAMYAFHVLKAIDDGRLPREDYEEMTFRQMVDFCQGRKAPQPPARALKSQGLRNGGDATPAFLTNTASDGIFDDSIPLQDRLTKCLGTAVDSLLASREIIEAEHLPAQWYALVSQAITLASKLQFEAKNTDEVFANRKKEMAI